MTVLMAVGVVPKNGSNPYVIMGADSKKISRKEGREDIIDEEYRKVFKNNDKLIGASGRFDDAYIEEIIKIFFDFESDRPVIELVELIKKSTTDFLVTNPNDNIRALILVGSIEDSIPIIAEINVYKINRIAPEIHSDTNSYIIRTNFQNHGEAYLEFESKINGNDKYNRVRKYLNNCLKKESALRPEICNQKIIIESIGK